MTPPRRINIVGTSGSGKTTLAKAAAQKMGVPHVELDALHWEPNWVEASTEVFRARLEQALSGPAWTVDGNYSKGRDIVWARADMVVWLDFSLPLMLWRVVRRTLRRAIMREALWNGNREDLRTAFFSRDSIIWWMLTSYRRRRVEFGEVFARGEPQHIAFVRLKSPRQAREWLDRL